MDSVNTLKKKMNFEVLREEYVIILKILLALYLVFSEKKVNYNFKKQFENLYLIF